MCGYEQVVQKIDRFILYGFCCNVITLRIFEQLFHFLHLAAQQHPLGQSPTALPQLQDNEILLGLVLTKSEMAVAGLNTGTSVVGSGDIVCVTR